jgi:hypothetical protein
MFWPIERGADAMPIPIENLEPGTRFYLAGIPERTGTLLSLSPGAALVRYDGRGRHVVIYDLRTDSGRAFDVPGRPITISRSTAVCLMNEAPDAAQDCR